MKQFHLKSHGFEEKCCFGYFSTMHRNTILGTALANRQPIHPHGWKEGFQTGLPVNPTLPWLHMAARPNQNFSIYPERSQEPTPE